MSYFSTVRNGRTESQLQRKKVNYKNMTTQLAKFEWLPAACAAPLTMIWVNKREYVNHTHSHARTRPRYCSSNTVFMPSTYCCTGLAPFCRPIYRTSKFPHGELSFMENRRCKRRFDVSLVFGLKRIFYVVVNSSNSNRRPLSIQLRI